MFHVKHPFIDWIIENGFKVLAWVLAGIILVCVGVAIGCNFIFEVIEGYLS